MVLDTLIVISHEEHPRDMRYIVMVIMEYQAVVRDINPSVNYTAVCKKSKWGINT